MINGSTNSHQPKISQEYFPILWKKSGFSMGLYLKGKGSILIQLSRESPSVLVTNSDHVASSYSLMVDFGEKKLIFQDAVNQNIISKQVSSDLVLSEDKFTSYWFEMRCSKRAQRIDRFYNCFIHFGKSGDQSSLFEVNIGNPFKALQLHPTFVSFIPVSNDTSIQVSFECTRTFGDICAHTDECKKTSNDLICGNVLKQHSLKRINGVKTFEEDRCMCHEKNMRWVEEKKKCMIS